MHIKKKNNQCVYISRDDLDWIFPDKCSLKTGSSVRGFTFNITPKVNDDLRNCKNLILYQQKDCTEEAIEKLGKIGTDFYINESYFLYDKSSFIEQTFTTALNKKISIYGSISYLKSKKDIVKIIDPEEFLKFNVKKDTLKDSLSLQLANVSGNIPQLRLGKIEKRKRQIPEPAESVIICAHQNFDIDSGLNQVRIELEDDRIVNIQKKHKNGKYRLMPLGFLFPSSGTNDMEQIFITCRELNNAKKYLINCKIYGLIGITDLNKINN